MDGAPLNKAGFIGNAWWPREELIRFYPFPFDIVTVPKTEFSAPAIADVTLGLVQAYNRFNVAINMRSPFAGVSMRTFELMACGKYVITYRPAPDRAANIKLFDGWPHLAWFCEWSPSDQAKLLNYHTHLIANYAQTRQRGLENRQLILMGHTPAHRVSEIVSKL
jgi:hypothetical protein